MASPNKIAYLKLENSSETEKLKSTGLHPNRDVIWTFLSWLDSVRKNTRLGSWIVGFESLGADILLKLFHRACTDVSQMVKFSFSCLFLVGNRCGSSFRSEKLCMSSLAGGRKELIYISELLKTWGLFPAFWFIHCGLQSLAHWLKVPGNWKVRKIRITMLWLILWVAATATPI